MPFYIFHQLVIVWLGWVTFGWSNMPLVKYVTIAAAALVLSFCLARLCELTAVTRFLVGMKAGRLSDLRISGTSRQPQLS